MDRRELIGLDKAVYDDIEMICEEYDKSIDELGLSDVELLDLIFDIITIFDWSAWNDLIRDILEERYDMYDKDEKTV